MSKIIGFYEKFKAKTISVFVQILNEYIINL